MTATDHETQSVRFIVFIDRIVAIVFEVRGPCR